MKVLSIRFDKDMEKKLDYIVNKLKIKDRSAYIRQLLDKAFSEKIIEILSKEVGKGQMSAWKAADISEISLREFLRELKKRNIPGYDERALEEDLNFTLE
jgi:predicted HTH domain antitoxin